MAFWNLYFSKIIYFLLLSCGFAEGSLRLLVVVESIVHLQKLA